MNLARLPVDVRLALAELVDACASSGMVTADGAPKQAAIREAIDKLRPAAARWDRLGRPLEPVRGRRGARTAAKTKKQPPADPRPATDPPE